MKPYNLIVLTSPLVLAALGALAHSGASGVVLERMNGMTAMRDAMSELAPMMQGAVPYDAAAVSSLATTIGDHAGDTLLGLFPEGSIEGVTYARPEIWSGWPEFESLAGDLESYAAALAEAAPNGLSPAMPMDMDMSSGTMDMAGASAPPAETAYSVAELMGYGEPRLSTAGPSGASGGAGIDLAMQPVPRLFEGISNACSSCHAKFRAGRN